MADTRDQDGQDRDAETAKLELPSFPGFGRKRRPKKDAVTEPPVAPEAPAPAASPDATTTSEEPAADAVSEPAAARVETRSQDYTEPLMTDDQPTRVDAVLEPVEQPVASQVVADHPDAEPAAAPAAPVAPEPQRKAEKKPFALPQVDGRVAAAVTGAVVGLVGCVLTYLALSACEAIRGTQTCGGGPGFVILLLILAVMVVLGAAVLSLWKAKEPRATAFLGVGVLFVVMLLVLDDQLLSPWMFLVVPIVTALGFVLGHWVTTAFVEKVPEKGPQHDVR